jgi:hypothetical protein
MTRGRRIDLDAPTWLLLAAEVLHRVPRLPGALCTGQPALFDGDDAAGRDAAVALCQQCPALPDCRQWLAALRGHPDRPVSSPRATEATRRDGVGNPIVP